MSSNRSNRRCMRWGRSAYELPRDLKREAQALEALGLSVILTESQAPSFDGVEVLIVHSKKQVTANILERAQALRLVVATTSGVEHIDVCAANERDIRVARCPLARRDAVVESSLGMGLALLRDLPYFQRRAKAGDWARAKLPDRPILSLQGLRVGIIGCGVIGRRAEQVWQMLGTDVKVSDPLRPDSIPLDELARWSQLLTLHCSLNATTERLIDHSFLSQMASGSILLNTARGKCVDIDALQDAPPVGGIGRDVFPEEPWPGLAKLARDPRFLLTPHAAGYHEHLGRSVAAEVVETIDAWLRDGSLPHEVFPERS